MIQVQDYVCFLALAKEKQTEKRCTVASKVQHLHFCLNYIEAARWLIQL